MSAPATLADHLAAALDPGRLFLDVVGDEAEGWQGDLLRAPPRRGLVLCCRQSGKSLSTSVLALHRVVYTPGSLVVCISPTQRQSTEWYLKLRAGFRAIGRPVDVLAENESEMRFAGGSRVLALPGSEPTVRGVSSVDLLIIDEAARLDDDVWTAVQPMLAPDGTWLCLTTPAGMRGRFYELWTEGGPAWTRTKITIEDSGQYPPARIAELKASMSARDFAAEYMADFASNVESFFDPRAVARAFDCSVASLPGFPSRRTA